MKKIFDLLLTESKIDKIFYSIIFFYFLLGVLLINTFSGDSSIYFIYAKNIAIGDFFTFNRGEFSSGSTSPLWALVLSLYYHFPKTEFILKIFSLVLTIGSLIFFYKKFNLIVHNKFYSLISTLVLSYFLLITGFLVYEAPLIIFFISLIISLFDKVKNYEASKFEFMLFSLSVAILPSIRPDSAIISLSIFVAMIWSFKQNYVQSLKLFSLVLLFALPFLIYFIYSYFALDTASTSSYCRSFALKENAISLGFIHISLAAVKTFFSFPLIVFLITYKNIDFRKIKQSYLNLAGIISFIVYFIVFMFISPISPGYERYLIPILPFFLLIFGDSFKQLIKNPLSNFNKILILILISTPVFINSYDSISFFRKNLTFNKIIEKDLSEKLNNICDSNSVILSYEVQNRLFLRNDLKVLSLDGIIDGKVAPYLESGNMISFLLKYKPNFWIANDAVNYRPYLKKSILNSVSLKLLKNLNATVVIDGIKFTNIMINTEPKTKGFAGYTFVAKIEYLN